ncbi:uncharacterized protein F5Z01DRAFT_143422 [Emericellopsis atlantica]|uniref:HMG box domain-containing protein n=1 Tax=Emericellopsis atlantica TaxID=2614577 RepID=A0A9P7ZKT8_9HYPO|nr:uncharacterized protein F5Z01DRAFT_143422 [Emericellopsis atlantica]KAG9253532.1 hypothetical protein F5Z01DRAFT_143422 [Emericellopsis atlantica]
MARMAAPSPTPSTDELSQTCPMSTSDCGNEWSQHAQLGYDTPPLDDGPGCADARLHPIFNLQDYTLHATEHHSEAPQGSMAKHDMLSTCEVPVIGHQAQQQDGYSYTSANHHGNTGLDLQSSKKTVKGKKKAPGKPRRKDKKEQFPDLVEPLSRWAKDHEIQPLSVHNFATRDIKKRITRAVKDGYVKRNLNVFFLYKQAYANVAQAWMTIHHPSLARTQPPLVTLVGESWAKESDEFKRGYTKYSELEREGLRKAFPDYKYKPGTKKTQTGQDQSPQGRQAPTTPMRNGSCPPSDYSGTPGGSSNRSVSYQGSPRFDSGRYSGNEAYNTPCGPAPTSTGYHSHPLGGGHEGFLYPSPPCIGSQWSTPVRGRLARSVSPAFSQQSSLSAWDYGAVDPSLSGSFSDYTPSRSTSEEPGYVVPAHAFTNMPSIDFSRVPAGVPPKDNFADLLDPSIYQESTVDPARRNSADLWQGGGSVLSSIPGGDMVFQQLPGSDANEWHVEPVEHDAGYHNYTWDANIWSHGLEDDPLEQLT